MRDGLQILLIDDDEELLRTLCRVLVRAGHHVMTRTSVRDAQEIVGAGEFDVVISDYWMADGTGAEIASELRRVRPSTRLVFLTGDCACPSDGVVVLHKPVRTSELLQVIRNPATNRDT
jgi:DNA-binding NtrC family response regulator